MAVWCADRWAGEAIKALKRHSPDQWLTERHWLWPDNSGGLTRLLVVVPTTPLAQVPRTDRAALRAALFCPPPP